MAVYRFGDVDTLVGGVVLMVLHMCCALGFSLTFHDIESRCCERLLNSNLVIREQDIEPMLDLVGVLSD